MLTIILKSGRDIPSLKGHPWVFSGAIATVKGEGDPGQLAEIFSHEGIRLGTGYYNPQSQIAVRLLSTGTEHIDGSFFRRRIRHALILRQAHLPPRTDAYRVVNSEGDYLPGLIVDRYGDYLCIQLLTAGMERFRTLILENLQRELTPKSMYERSDSDSRTEEGLSAVAGPVGKAPFPNEIEIIEHGARYLVNVIRGQKTGFYLDQRDNRTLIRSLVEGREVLNCFSYTGGFSVSALLGGAAHVTAVESSKDALDTSQRNLALNNLPMERHRAVRDDVFQFFRRDSRSYDLIILDPPALAKRRGMVKGAVRGYKDLNLQAIKKARAGGLILTCSCSQHVDMQFFQKIVFFAAADVGRQVQILGRWGAPFDHPVALFHPEGAYFKTLLLRVNE